MAGGKSLSSMQQIEIHFLQPDKSQGQGLSKIHNTGTNCYTMIDKIDKILLVQIKGPTKGHIKIIKHKVIA